jgi:hypothetical protein
MVYKYQPGSPQFGEQFHRLPPVDLDLTNQIIGPAAGGRNRVLTGSGGKKGFQGKETAGVVPLACGPKDPGVLKQHRYQRERNARPNCFPVSHPYKNAL